MKWASKKDAERLSEMAIPFARETYPYLDAKVMERFINRELTAEAIEKNMGDWMCYAFIEVEGRTVGFVAYSVSGEVLHLDKLYISKDQRGKGVGTEVMKWLFNIALTEGYRQVELIVVDLNLNAVGFYRRLGFERISAEKGYAVRRSIMRKTFRSADLLSMYYI